MCAIGLAIFRAGSVHDAYFILQKMLGSTKLLSKRDWIEAAFAFGGGNYVIAVGSVTIGMTLLFFSIEWMEEKQLLSMPRWDRVPWNYAAWTTVALFQIILMFGVLRPSAFFYFQF